MTVVTLAVLLAAFFCYAVIFRMRTKQLMLKNFAFSLNSYIQKIDEDVLAIEDNSNDLALIGNLFYSTDRNPTITYDVITKVFENYPESLGGGIWFEPYVVNPSKKRTCFYAYRNKDNKVVVDKNFESEEYDYHNQNWYKQIKSQVTKENKIAWSLPYYENIGSNTMMITAGTGIFDGDKFIGMSTVDWEIGSIIKEVSEMKPTENGFHLFENNRIMKDYFVLLGSKDFDYILASTDPYLDNESLIGKSLKNIPWYKDNLKYITYITYHNRKYVPFVKYSKNGLVLIICLPKSEMFKYVDRFAIEMFLSILFICFMIPTLSYLIFKRYIINPIDKLTDIAHKIGRGEDVEIKLEKPEEFAQLALTFDNMTQNIKSITKERAKINSELSIAKSIQLSSLPGVFPPFPERSEFDIYASMTPAKEVGGDFYDFYFTDDDNLMFLIADVSGKGVPAALFMMTVKTLINNISLIGYPPKKMIETINKKICETNKQGFFVTMLCGIINIKTGKLSLINCGHNPPLIRKKNEEYEYLCLNSNIALGVVDDAEFEIFETQLNEGDIIFTYTDGITEAMNDREELFGEKRLLACLNNIKGENQTKEILNNIKNDINNYTNSAPQSDDITMLIFKYQKENSLMKTFSQIAIPENYKPFYTWLHSICDEWKLSDELKNKLDMCSEELFANITFYAYPESNGIINVSIDNSNDEITLKFEDEGIPYNPLEKPDPDINLPPEERPLGGLGIFMVKEMVKNIFYERIQNKNILTLKF
ncbi:SpoIIE family protein phosphatase [bacterium]|nr:SpoIIE family protein phosphatase [bacterium]